MQLFVSCDALEQRSCKKKKSQLLRLPLSYYQLDYFTPLSSHGTPMCQVKALTIDGFHIHIGKVMGLQSFFVFYGPSGIVSAAWTTGITIQREVRGSSNRPHFSESNVSNIHMPPTSSSIGNTGAFIHLLVILPHHLTSSLSCSQHQ